MSTIVKVLDDEKINTTSPYYLDEFYMHLKQWLEWHKFEVEEKQYKEKRKVGGDGVESKDITILWEATKDYDEYTRITITLRYMILGQKDVEVQQAGNKVKMQRSDLTLFVSASYTLDKNDRFKKLGMNFLQRYYEKFLYKDTAEQIKNDVWKIGWEFFNEIKAFLNLYKFG